MPTLDKIHVNIVVMSSIIVFVGGMTFFLGSAIARTDEKIMSVQERQIKYDQTQEELVRTINKLSLSVESIAGSLGVQTK